VFLNISKLFPNYLKIKFLDYISSHPYVYKKISEKIECESKKYYGITAEQAIIKLIRDFDFVTVLDVGSGEGVHSRLFLEAGKAVTSLDYGDSIYFEKCSEKQNVIRCDYYKFIPDKVFDCVWASHVLEHQPNPNLFLKRIYNDLKPGGIAAITVPPLKNEIVGGHVNLYNAGLLLYQMVLAGFDCSNASVATYGYNISVIVCKPEIDLDLSMLSFDSGDINKISRYLPDSICNLINDKDLFNGDISSINW
jgi:SAM-dependent methyltransferase